MVGSSSTFSNLIFLPEPEEEMLSADWFDDVEVKAILQALEGLGDGRLDAVVEG